MNEWGQWMLDLRNSTHALLSDAASQPQAQLDVEQAKKALKTMREVDEEVKKEKAILVFRQKKLEEEDEDSDVAYARKEAGTLWTSNIFLPWTQCYLTLLTHFQNKNSRRKLGQVAENVQGA